MKGDLVVIGDFEVVTLCGSTRFEKQFREVQKKLTLSGKIVISPGFFSKAGDMDTWDNIDSDKRTEIKEMLICMHLKKIDLSDSIYVVNPGGYIGEECRREINYALKQGKKISYLEEP